MRRGRRTEGGEDVEERDHEGLVHTFISDNEFMLRVLWQGQVWQWSLSTREIDNLKATVEAWERDDAFSPGAG